MPMATQLEMLDKPKRKMRALMHVVDAGDHVISLKCGKCAYSTGWIAWDRNVDPVSKMKRGVPCPRCEMERTTGPKGGCPLCGGNWCSDAGCGTP